MTLHTAPQHSCEGSKQKKKLGISLADPGEARGCSTNTPAADWLINWLSNPLVKISLRRRHAQTVKNGASSHKTNCIDIYSEILNLEEHLYRCIGSKVTAILLNGWILPTGGVASGRVCPTACAAGLFNYTLILKKNINQSLFNT